MSIIAKQRRQQIKDYWKCHEIDLSGTQMCISCHQTMSRNNFNINRSSDTGLCAYCKTCNAEKVRRTRLKNRIKWTSALPDASGTKRCRKCKLEFQKSNFYIDRGTKDGFTTQCKGCIKRAGLRGVGNLQQEENTATDIIGLNDIPVEVAHTASASLSPSICQQDDEWSDSDESSLSKSIDDRIVDVFAMGPDTSPESYTAAVRSLTELPHHNLLMLRNAVNEACASKNVPK
jgi:hypothetical protein